MSEETEVKKDIEWLKEEVWKQDIVMDKGYIYTDDLMSIINELDEPVVLSDKWIDEHKISRINNLRKMTMSDVVPVDKLQNLLLPKQEEVKVPQFIADYLPLVKEDIELEKASYYAVTNNELSKWKREYDWIRENFETFVKAWLAYPNIEVEEEQKYVVELPNPNNQMGRHKNVFLNKKDGKVFIDLADLFVNDITKYGQFALTEEEIKKDFEWAWEFAKPVEELEE